jgi:hypothetical protein
MVQKTRDQQVLEEGSMASEAAIVQALDALTNPPSTRSLTRATTSHLGLMQGILNRRDVIGVGISEKISQGKPTGTLALSVYVVKKQPLRSLRGNQVIPPVLPLELSNDQAIPTDVLEVGQVRPQLAVKPMVIRKPVQPGYSIGHTSVTAGTLGAIVQSGTTLYILSNSHVLAQGGLASIGDAIVYPGPADGGNDPADIVARLSRFIPFIAGGTFVNTSDCAIAEILPERLAQVRADIKGLGFPNGTTKPTRGMEVTKVGRTTRKTAGKITDVHFRFAQKYPGVGKAGFIDQVVCTRYSSGGDSGSLVLDKTSSKAVGLHFAGSDPTVPFKNAISVFSPIDVVLQALGVSLVTESLEL